MPEVPKKPPGVAFKSSFGPQNILVEDTRTAVKKVIPQIKAYDKVKNVFQTKVMNEMLNTHLCNTDKLHQAITDAQEMRNTYEKTAE